MIGITHTGKLGDFINCLPICSWLYKQYNEKILFIFPYDFPFMDKAESVIRLQEFTHDIKYVNFDVKNYDCGGQPYKFNPHDFINDIKLSRYYNLGLRSIPNKFITEFVADEHFLGVDPDFVLNLGLEFKPDSNKIMCSEVMGEFFPYYEQPDFNQDFLTNLRELAYAKERHLHSSSLAAFMNQAKIPYYLYMIVRIQPFVNVIGHYGWERIDNNGFPVFYKDAPVLDIRTVTDDKKIVSIYNQIFFK